MGKTNRKTAISLLLALGITLPAIGSAAAPSQFEDVSVRVSYADLNIESEAGAKVLYSRLKHASEKACNVGSYLEDFSVSRAFEAKTCYRNALAKAVENIGSDALTRMHTG